MDIARYKASLFDVITNLVDSNSLTSDTESKRRIEGDIENLLSELEISGESLLLYRMYKEQRKIDYSEIIVHLAQRIYEIDTGADAARNDGEAHSYTRNQGERQGYEYVLKFIEGRLK